MLNRLHARLGDFWWYSLMLFCACRAADLLNAFVGLWLVPNCRTNGNSPLILKTLIL